MSAFSWLGQPLPEMKAWHAIWLMVTSMYYGAWIGTSETANSMGEPLGLHSHFILLGPVWLLLMGYVVSKIDWRRGSKTGVAQ